MNSMNICPSKLLTASVCAFGLATFVACTTTHKDAGECAAKCEAHAGHETETTISLSDLPAAVRSALAGITAEDKILQITRDQEGDKTSYDIEYSKNGVRWAAEFSPSGSVLENEADHEDDDEDDE